MSKRVLVIGLDGGTWTVYKPYIEAGLLPTLASLWERSYRATLHSTRPPITPVAWTSMVTGVNPGKHRVFGFADCSSRQGSYITPPANRRTIAMPTLHRILSDHGLCSRIVNLPLTYPPDEINGSIVTGMFTPSAQVQFTWPAELREELLEQGLQPKFVPDMTLRIREGQAEAMELALRGDASEFLDDVDDMTRRQHRIACHLMRKDWQYFMMVYQASDIIQHGMWNELLPPPTEKDESVRRRRIAQSYRLVDDCMAELLDLAGPETTVLIVSDHGFGPCAGNYVLGQWLAERGYATYHKKSASRLIHSLIKRLRLRHTLLRLLERADATSILDRNVRILWSETRAFVDGGTAGEGIRINTRGVFREGIVDPGNEYDQLRNELIQALKQLRIEPGGAPVILDVLKREDIYEGPHVSEAPDLIRVENPDALVGLINGTAEGPRLVPIPGYQGKHLREGICLIADPASRVDGQIHDADIMDITPTVLTLFGLPVPEYMDGRVLAEAFQQAPNVTHSSAGPARVSQDDGEVFSEAERLEIEERLRNLGYLE